MNIVYQIGDALYEEMPSSVAVHVVRARQATNDKAIDFATKLIRTNFIPLADLKERIEGMKAAIDHVEEKTEADRIYNLLNDNMVFGFNTARTELLKWLASLEKPNK